MLVLKLKVGDRVEIGDGVILECRHVSPGTLRLAIAAPADMGIAHKHGAAFHNPHPPNPAPPNRI